DLSAYERQGYVDIALKYTREYLQQFPNDDYSFNLKIKIGGFLRRLGQFQEAVQQYRRLLPLADGDAAAEIQFYIGETYFESGQFEKAIVEYLRLKYTRIKTKFPWRTTAVYKAGICYMRLRQYPRARKLFEWVVRMEGAGSIFGKSAQEKIREIDRQLSQLTSAKQND
ncbi:MAG: tetratricopeptide repeat protein, partial [candidate division KSB1 bacterium]|nr:tetratricopeptide repeat protein [candidate division KSB1 bacterium]